VVVEDHHLHVAVGVRDDRHARHLGARARGGRDGDERQSRVRDLVISGVLADGATVRGHHGDRLAGVERGAAAEGHHAVRFVGAQRREPGFDVGHCRIGLDLGEHRGLEAGPLAPVRDLAGEPALLEIGIRDHEDARYADSRCDVAGFERGSTADHDVLGRCSSPASGLIATGWQLPKRHGRSCATF
jgi:hypothetical protein